jgi:hypothetical protein
MENQSPVEDIIPYQNIGCTCQYLLGLFPLFHPRDGRVLHFSRMLSVQVLENFSPDRYILHMGRNWIQGAI